MTLSKLEEDFIGDLAGSNHYLWEVYQFVRLHYKEADELTVREIGYELLKSWVERGWLTASLINDPTKTLIDNEIIDFVERLGEGSANPQENSLELELTEKAFNDVSWLTK